MTDTASTDAFAASVHGAFDGAPVSLLHANAGVGAGPTILDSTPDDWLFTFRVNVYGVVNTLRSFVPTMVERGAPAAVVCTSSIAGIMGQSGGAYGASKHACTVLAEGVFAEVAPTAPHLSFHTLHPQIVDTKIDESQRNRPEDLSDLSATDFLDLGGIGDKLFHERGMPPSGTAAHLFAGVGRGDFYIFSENPGDEGWTRKAVMARMSSLVSRGVPIGSPPMNMAAGLMPQEVRSAAPVSANCNDAEALQGGIAVITGGASGIGLAVAHAALDRGLHVAIGDVEAAALEPAVAELRAAAPAGLQVEGFRCDVTDAAGMDAFAASVHGAFDGAPVSLLHCNAGIGVGQSTLQATEADWEFVK